MFMRNYWCFVLLLVCSILPAQEVWYINPGKEGIPPFKLAGTNTNIRISPKNGIEAYYVSYIIKNNKGVPVFEKENLPANFEDFPELFVTEETQMYIRLPNFEWNGENNQSSGGGSVDDGEYTLSIQFKNQKLGFLADTNGNPLQSYNTYKIIVKKSFDPFVIKNHRVSNNKDNSWIYTEKYIFDIFSLSDRNSEIAPMASGWNVSIQNNDSGEQVFSSTFRAVDQGKNEIPLPVIEWAAETTVPGHYRMAITGVDNVKNEYTAFSDILLEDPVKITPEIIVEERPVFIEKNVQNTSVSFGLASGRIFDISRNAPVVSGHLQFRKKEKSLWMLNIYSRDGSLIKEILRGQEDDVLHGMEYSWDGRGNDGVFAVKSGEEYTLVLEFEDGETFSERLFSGLPVKASGDTLAVDINDIIFPSYKVDFINDEHLMASNGINLSEIAKGIIAARNTISLITIEGYANPVYYADAARLQKENREILIPLSLQRAEFIKKLLVMMGVPGDILLARGRGGLDWIANPGDTNENYKNRRVRFLVELKK